MHRTGLTVFGLDSPNNEHANLPPRDGNARGGIINGVEPGARESA
ncbi:hypothetical protein [Rhizobacter sp. P5_C2]